jgi:GNAT superfamily N-acetyltransferase
MDTDEIEIKTVTRVDRRDVKELYRQAGWWNDDDETPDGSSWIDAMVGGSFCFVGAFRRGRMIGMGRAVSDGASDAYIQDVTVLKEFRGRGLGALIVGAIRDFLLARGIGWIGLVAEPGTQPFYRRLGFAALAGYTAMKLEKKGD